MGFANPKLRASAPGGIPDFHASPGPQVPTIRPPTRQMATRKKTAKKAAKKATRKAASSKAPKYVYTWGAGKAEVC